MCDSSRCQPHPTASPLLKHVRTCLASLAQLSCKSHSSLPVSGFSAYRLPQESRDHMPQIWLGTSQPSIWSITGSASFRPTQPVLQRMGSWGGAEDQDRGEHGRGVCGGGGGGGGGAPDASILCSAHHRVLNRAQVEDVDHVVNQISFGTSAHVLWVPQPSAVLQILPDCQILMHNVILHALTHTVTLGGVR